MKVVDLKVLVKEHGLRGYSKLRKVELITFLQNNLRPTPTPSPRTRSPRPTPAPCTRPPRPAPASCTRPPRPTRPPPPQMSTWEPQALLSVRPRQPELHPPPDSQNPRPYQLRPKRGKETFIELPPSNSKQIKRMKKKLGELNKKVRHSKRKHNNLISKRNSIKKKIEELKGPHEPKELHEPEESFNPIELKQTFNRAYRSYRINGRSRMGVDTFLNRIKQNLIDLMNREVTDLGSAKVQMTAWIRFRVEVEDENRNIIGVDRVEKPFNSRITDIYQCSDLNEIVNEMLAHMKMQIENPALANSRFVFNEVLFLDVNFHQLNLTRGSSYIPLPDWIASKRQ